MKLNKFQKNITIFTLVLLITILALTNLHVTSSFGSSGTGTLKDKLWDLFTSGYMLYAKKIMIKYPNGTYDSDGNLNVTSYIPGIRRNLTMNDLFLVICTNINDIINFSIDNNMNIGVSKSDLLSTQPNTYNFENFITNLKTKLYNIMETDTDRKPFDVTPENVLASLLFIYNVLVIPLYYTINKTLGGVDKNVNNIFNYILGLKMDTRYDNDKQVSVLTRYFSPEYDLNKFTDTIDDYLDKAPAEN